MLRGDLVRLRCRDWRARMHHGLSPYRNDGYDIGMVVKRAPPSDIGGSCSRPIVWVRWYSHKALGDILAHECQVLEKL